MHTPSNTTFSFYVVNAESKTMGATVHAEDAAAFASMLGDGAAVTTPMGAILWTEGDEDFSAADSYDGAAEIILKRAQGVA